MKSPTLKIDWATYDAARYAVMHWHYSQCMPCGKLVKFAAYEDGKFIGVVLFGRGANKGLVAPYGLKQSEGCELVRIALTKHHAPVSRIVAICLRMLKAKFPSMRLIVSFADSQQGHHGGIYQAGNWIYAGQSNTADEYIYKGRRYHGRAFRMKYGSHKKYLDKGLQIVSGSSKHRYLMPLDNEMRKQIKGMSKSYPKRSKQAEATPVELRRCDTDPTAPICEHVRAAS
jgi:hypothetical protein